MNTAIYAVLMPLVMTFLLMDVCTQVHFPSGTIFLDLKIAKIMEGLPAYRVVWMKMRPTLMPKQPFNPKMSMETFYVPMRHARRLLLMDVFTPILLDLIAPLLAIKPV